MACLILTAPEYDQFVSKDFGQVNTDTMSGM